MIKTDNKNIYELLKYLSFYKGQLIIVTLSLIITTASLLMIGYSVKTLVDYGIRVDQAEFSQLDIINSSIGKIITLVVIFAVGSFLRSYFINIITEKVTVCLKVDTYRNLLQVELVKFEELKTGDLVTRLTADINNVGKLITNFFSFFLRNSIMLIGSIIMMLMQSPKLAFGVMVSVPILLLPLLKLSKIVRKLSRELLNIQGNLTSYVEESFTAIRALHAYNRQAYVAEEFNKKNYSYLKFASHRLKLRSLFFALVITVIALAITVIIWAGSLDIIRGNLSAGRMLSFIYYAFIAGMSAGGIAEFFSEVQISNAALERILELKFLPGKRERKAKMALNRPYIINFKQVSFAYPARPELQILNNISFVIKEGQFIGIAGHSGAGKSTIMQLILKFYPYKYGVIKIGWENINDMQTRAIRNIIAYVEQNAPIFTGTIYENIVFANPNAPLAEVTDIADLCGISEFTHNFPNGLNTEIGEKGIRISGGQRQRIAIARALLHKPEILLLDEATSALDNESEKKIITNVRNRLVGKTIVSIAHRISAIESADNILVMDNGQIIDSGSHRELLASSKIYNILGQDKIKSLVNTDELG